MNWTREQAIRDVLEASDGAEGIVDDGTGKRRWPFIQIPLRPSLWLEARAKARNIIEARGETKTYARKGYRWCFGSGKKSKQRGTSRRGPFSVCMWCTREISLVDDGKMAYHGLKTDDCRELAVLDPLIVSCTTCGAKAGEKCLKHGEYPAPRRESHKARKRSAAAVSSRT